MGIVGGGGGSSRAIYWRPDRIGTKVRRNRLKETPEEEDEVRWSNMYVQ